MLLRNWFAELCRKLTRSSNRLFRRRPMKRQQRAAGRSIEDLELRTLLSVRAVFDPSTQELQVTAKHGESVKLGVNKHGDVTVNGHRVKFQGPDGKTASNVAGIESIVINGGDRSNKIDLSGVTESRFTGLTNVAIHGNAGDDLIVGSQFNDDITGGTGNDDIHGGGGHDSIHGDDGQDLIHGGIGNDDLTGGTGTDEIHGDDGDDSLHGDANDSEDGGAGNNISDHGTPTHEPPVEEPPTHEPPVHEPPTHEPPVEEPPAHEPPVHEPPTHEPPVHGAV